MRTPRVEVGGSTDWKALLAAIPAHACAVACAVCGIDRLISGGVVIGPIAVVCIDTLTEIVHKLIVYRV